MSRSKSYIFKSSPTVQQMKSDWKYRKTLRNYEGVIEDGMMVMLEDVEDFPAPALCAFCENPVITQTKSVRSGSQWYVVSELSLHRVYSVFQCNPHLRQYLYVKLMITRFKIAWFTVLTAGIFTYPVASSMCSCFPTNTRPVPLGYVFDACMYVPIFDKDCIANTRDRTYSGEEDCSLMSRLSTRAGDMGRPVEQKWLHHKSQGTQSLSHSNCGWKRWGWS